MISRRKPNSRFRDARLPSVRTLLCAAIVTLVLTVFLIAQPQEEVGAGPVTFTNPATNASPPTFTNIPGGMQDSNVNVKTGKVGMSVTLGQVSDHSSPPFKLQAHYTSNVESFVKIWNKEYKPAPIGLGWDLPQGRIIRHTQGTGAELDDTFLYSPPSGGQFVQLLLTDSSGSIDTYTVRHQYVPDTIFEHHKNNNINNGDYSHWVVIHKDGSRSYYGGEWGVETGADLTRTHFGVKG